ncbi:MerR family transcriptional regulator [Absiella sp. AM54-8XD]|jgi:DNA-binding transcriptional MerR regulator|nr:MerR family transcriptional regulator [Absiella sp. AM22-9]RGB58981.1 MerR family transcriptional regulator [Absiella sp. AM10-20]RGB65339.1 MerR family transcriptional regulator [Absiella sp. AM09-45]RGB74365.1 MerR family transcriptional regulator [Absiella sp. AM09-50]RGC17087.1 MerR family transcriptional regulator [Absiella sp. AM54-8XD]RHU10517.1 MerR family transcriptional regulator [Absiella sp. AM27-20]
MLYSTQVIKMSEKYTIKEVSELFHVPKSTLRYWESEGIIGSNRNDHNEYREYTTEDLIIIADILFYRNLNIPVKDLKNIYQKSIHENMNILYASYDRIEKQIQELKKVQTKIKKRVSAGMIYENLIHDTPTYDKPYFSSIVHIHMGKKTQNVLDYIQDQSILAFVMNPDDTIIQVYGTITDHQDDQQDILWTKQEQAQYLPCYLKLSESIVDQVTLQRSLQQVYDIKKKPGKIIANYLITDKNDDYFQAWIELLD